MIFTNQVKQNPKTKAKFAPGKNDRGFGKEGYQVWALGSHYDGKVRGGIRHSWCLVAEGLTLNEAKALLNKRCGIKIYEDVE